jgi:hypothetical protein
VPDARSPAAPPEPEPEPKRIRRFSGATLALFTALLALASAGVGLVFDLKPELRPDPRTTLRAELSVFAVEQQVPVDDWLHRVTTNQKAYRARRARFLRDAFEDVPKPSAQDVRAQLAVTGELFYVRTEINGFKRRSLRLRWSMYGARSQRRLATEGLQNVTGAELVGAAPSDASVSLVWTPAVPAQGLCFARFELIEPAGAVLAVADSQRFPGLIESEDGG